MQCLKCGRDVEEGQSFCRDCLRLIAQQPIQKDIALVLPHREISTSRKPTGKKRVLTTEEKLAQTRQQLHQSRILTVILSVLLVLLIGLCVFLMLKPKQPAMGQNYMTPASISTTGVLPVN